MNAKTNRLLVFVLVLQGLTLLGQWLNPSYTQTASAQVPDGGAQRLQMLEEARGTNARLDKILSLLNDGKLQVHVAKDDEKK